MSMREERVIVWSIFSITDQTMKTTMRPIATATTAEMRKDRISSVKSTSVPDRVAAIAVWKITREAASLNSPSLCRVDMIRRGIGTVPATASTATESGRGSVGGEHRTERDRRGDGDPGDEEQSRSRNRRGRHADEGHCHAEDRAPADGEERPRGLLGRGEEQRGQEQRQDELGFDGDVGEV